MNKKGISFRELQKRILAKQGRTTQIKETMEMDKNEQRKSDHLNDMLLPKALRDSITTSLRGEDDAPENAPLPLRSNFDSLSSSCATLRDVMLDAGIGADRIGDMVAYPEFVIDVAIEYFKGVEIGASDTAEDLGA